MFMKAFNVSCRHFKINFEHATPESARITQLLSTFVEQIPSRLFYSNISKTGAFVELLEGIIIEHPGLIDFLLGKDLLFRLLELVIGRDSSYMKYHPYVHDLPNHTVTTVLNMVARLVPYRLNLAGYAAKELKDITPSNTTSLEASVLANPKLWQKIGKNKYESAGIGSILLQYSYKDCQFSAMAAELMLAQLNQKETLFEDEAKQLVKVHFLLFRTSRTS